MYRRTVGFCTLTAASMSVVDASGREHAGLLHRVVGNTIHYTNSGARVFEFLDPAGDIRGESSQDGKFSACWWLLDERTMCFESADPMSGGCLGIELVGDRIALIRRDGVNEGPFELLPGNPRGL